MASLNAGNSAASIRHEYIVASDKTYPRPLVFRQRLEQYRMVESTVFRAQAAVSEKQTLPKGTVVITTGEIISAYEINNSLEVFGVFEKPLLKDNEQVDLLIRYVRVVEMKKPGESTFTKINEHSKLCYLPIDDPYTYEMDEQIGIFRFKKAYLIKPIKRKDFKKKAVKLPEKVVVQKVVDEPEKEKAIRRVKLDDIVINTPPIEETKAYLPPEAQGIEWEVIQENVRKDQVGIAFRKFINKPEPNKKKRQFIPHKYVRIGRDMASNDMNDSGFIFDTNATPIQKMILNDFEAKVKLVNETDSGFTYDFRLDEVAVLSTKPGFTQRNKVQTIENIDVLDDKLWDDRGDVPLYKIPIDEADPFDNLIIDIKIQDARLTGRGDEFVSLRDPCFDNQTVEEGANAIISIKYGEEIFGFHFQPGQKMEDAKKKQGLQLTRFIKIDAREYYNGFHWLPVYCPFDKQQLIRRIIIREEEEEEEESNEESEEDEEPIQPRDLEVPRMLLKSDGRNLRMNEIIVERPAPRVDDISLEFRHLKEYATVNYLEELEIIAVSENTSQVSHEIETLKRIHQIIKNKVIQEEYFYMERKYVGAQVLATVPAWGKNKEAKFKAGIIDCVEEDRRISINFVNGETHLVKKQQVVYPYHMLDDPTQASVLDFKEQGKEYNYEQITGILLSFDPTLTMANIKKCEKGEDGIGNAEERFQIYLKEYEEFYNGDIIGVNNNGTFNILFEDGDTKSNVSIEHIKNCVQVDLTRFNISVNS